jgi:arsenate reductase
MNSKPQILVLCTGNSCRSQMAEGFLRKNRGDRFDVESAGTEPKSEVHPLAVRVMAEIGIDISRQRPKLIPDFSREALATHLLIVCDKANAACPRIAAGNFTKTYMPFDDPAGATGSEEQRLDVFRRVRDEIGRAMKTWEPASSGRPK